MPRICTRSTPFLQVTLSIIIEKACKTFNQATKNGLDKLTLIKLGGGGVRVSWSWSKNFDHDIGQNFKVFVVKWSEILTMTMTMAKIQIFYGQYIHLTIIIGKSRGVSGHGHFVTMTMGDGRNLKISVVKKSRF